MAGPLWTTKDGETFPIQLMSDTHLNNALMMLRRRGYITTEEAGPMPEALGDRMIWASKPASTLLDALAVERLHRIETNAPPLDEDEAILQQSRWRAAVDRRRAEQWRIVPHMRTITQAQFTAELRKGAYNYPGSDYS